MSTQHARDLQFGWAGGRTVAWGVALGAAFLLAACGAGSGGGGGGGGDGGGSGANPSTITVSEVLPPGTTCPTGGQEIFYGIDDNGNGVLDEAERDGSVAICNGLGGTGVLIAIVDEPAGENCPYGGDRMNAGLDDGEGEGSIAGDGTLQTGEIDQSYWICGYGSGLGDGEVIAALSLSAGEVYHARVAAGGRSYYQWTPPADGSYAIGLLRTDSDLGWIHDNDAFITPYVSSCDNTEGVDEDEFCLTPMLTGGTTYYLTVIEQSGIPNLFDLSLGVPVLTAVDQAGRIFRIDPEFGTSTLLARSEAEGLSSMVFLPQLGVVQAGTGYNPDCGEEIWSCYYSVDPFTGGSTFIAGSETTQAGNFMDMSVDPDSGDLFAMESTECDNLRWVDVETGATESVADRPDDCSSDGLGMTFDGSGLIYLTAGSAGITHLWYGNPAIIGEAGWTDVGSGTELRFQDVYGYDLPSAYIVSMTVNPLDGKVYGIAVTGSGYGLVHFLVSVDLEYASATYVAPLASQLDGLAYIGGGRVPYPPVHDLAVNVTTDSLDLFWREYPAAETFNIYWVRGLGITIDPTDDLTYDDVFTGITSAPYNHFVCETADYHSYVVAAVVGETEVAFSMQSYGYKETCP